MTTVHDALRSRELGALQKVLSQTSDVNERDKMGRTALMYAVVYGLMDFVHLLLAHGAVVNLKDKKGWTALHFAAQAYNYELVSTLLQHGAIVDVQDSFGNTPLWRAVFEATDRGDVIRLLLSHGADKYLKNNHGVSPLDLAHTIANYDVAQFLE